MLNSSDEQLMQAYKEGSVEAFRELYRRHSDKVYGYLKKRLGKNQQSLLDDLFQEVFVKIHRFKHLYRSELPLLPWIFTVTHSVLVDGVRKAPLHAQDSEVDPDSLAAPENSRTEIPWTDLFRKAELSGSHVTALELRYFEGRDFQEIAKALETSESNVRQLISRALRKLKTRIDKGGAHE